MRYLLDSDIFSYLMRPSPPITLTRRLRVVPMDDQATSSITIGELAYGAFRAPSRTSELLARMESVLMRELRVLDFDTPAAHRYGELRAALERRGLPIGEADTQIAAIALVHNLTVVTGNLRHFERVPGLRVENWLA